MPKSDVATADRERLGKAPATAGEHYGAKAGAACVALCLTYDACKRRQQGTHRSRGKCFSSEPLSKTIRVEHDGYRIFSDERFSQRPLIHMAKRAICVVGSCQTRSTGEGRNPNVFSCRTRPFVVNPGHPDRRVGP